MKYYLRYVYELRLSKDQPEEDFIGPFEFVSDALAHQAKRGPVKATVVQRDDSPTPCMSVQEHIEYMERRT